MKSTRREGSLRLMAFGLESSKVKGSSVLSDDYQAWLHRGKGQLNRVDFRSDKRPSVEVSLAEVLVA